MRGLIGGCVEATEETIVFSFDDMKKLCCQLTSVVVLLDLCLHPPRQNGTIPFGGRTIKGDLTSFFVFLFSFVCSHSDDVV